MVNKGSSKSLWDALHEFKMFIGLVGVFISLIIFLCQVFQDSSKASEHCLDKERIRNNQNSEVILKKPSDFNYLKDSQVYVIDFPDGTRLFGCDIIGKNSKSHLRVNRDIVKLYVSKRKGELHFELSDSLFNSNTFVLE
ncbi:hypothetical protein [Jiulongibacter sp. NS-SX5]|uniref:hypothetical protein n=1 Tax=Jiulongibacter sp. NS-SX5 TaxID=3463854 RepID=UPI0040599D0A